MKIVYEQNIIWTKKINTLDKKINTFRIHK
jgi:hypothetical protein